jgi:hypothetical protein
MLADSSTTSITSPGSRVLEVFTDARSKSRTARSKTMATLSAVRSHPALGRTSFRSRA